MQHEWQTVPARTALRIAVSIVRQSVPHLRRAVVPYDGGRSRIIADLGTNLGLTLYRYGFRDPYIDLVRQLLSPGDIFVDAGANVGLFSLAAAERVGPTGKVIAIEPAPSTYSKLIENVKLNGFTWVETHADALAEKAGTKELIVFADDLAGFNSFAPAILACGRTATVRTVTLDGLLAERDLDRLRLVKLDIEGAEYLALQGAPRVLSEARPDFVVEIVPDHLERQGASAPMLVGTFRAHGYEFFQAGWDAKGHLTLTPEDRPGAQSDNPNLFATTDVTRAVRSGASLIGKSKSEG
jgi:FkbM family methyltransferase